MATITPTLTITSSDAFSDAISVSVTDSLSALGPCSAFKVTVGTGGYQIYADSTNKKTYFFIKNHGTAAITCNSDGSGAASISFGLAQDEWAWFPWDSTGDDLFLDATENTVVEVMKFQNVA